MSEGGKLTIKESALLANDLETDNDPLRITAVSDALNGRASMDGTAIFYARRWVGDDHRYSGSDVRVVAHGVGETMVTVDVTPVNDSPVPIGDTVTVEEGVRYR